MVALGIRLNNPANIRCGSSWLGLSKEPKSKSFCTFDDTVFGIRALLVVLRTYHYKHKKNTIAQVIHRFAPLSENNTYAYIANVQKFLRTCIKTDFGYGMAVVCESMIVNKWFNKKEPSLWVRYLCMAICYQETNYLLSMNEIDEAIKLL